MDAKQNISLTSLQIEPLIVKVILTSLQIAQESSCHMLVEAAYLRVDIFNAIVRHLGLPRMTVPLLNVPLIDDVPLSSRNALPC